MANNITIEHLLLLLYIVVIYFVRRKLHQKTMSKYNAPELNIDIFSFFFTLLSVTDIQLLYPVVCFVITSYDNIIK